MGCLLRSLPLLFILLGYCTPQNDIDNVIITLNAIAEKQNELLRKFNEIQTKISTIEDSQKTSEENIAQLQTTMSIIQESVNTVEGNVEQLPTTMAIIKESLNIVEENVEQQHEGVRSLEQCSTKDQIYELLDLLATDECYAGNTNCSDMATCIDTCGHYKCVCLPGYTGNGFSCEDVNECEEGEEEDMPKCHPHATCHNNVGSFECRCLSGYTGDGHTCECNSPSHEIPGLGCIIPVKEKKTWDDAQENCRRKGARLVEEIKAEHIRMLEQHFFNYIGQTWVHIGLRDGMWVTSRDPLSPEDPIWITDHPDVGADECGQTKLNRPLDSAFGDFPCSEEYPSLCQHHDVK